MNRYCPDCKHDHGPLYICKYYSSELKQKIQKQSDQFKKDLYDPKWIEQQLNNGIPPEAINIFRIFAQ